MPKVLKMKTCSYCNRKGHSRTKCPKFWPTVHPYTTGDTHRKSGKPMVVEEVRIAFRIIKMMRKLKNVENKALSDTRGKRPDCRLNFADGYQKSIRNFVTEMNEKGRPFGV